MHSIPNLWEIMCVFKEHNCQNVCNEKLIPHERIRLEIACRIKYNGYILFMGKGCSYSSKTHVKNQLTGNKYIRISDRLRCEITA